MNEQQNSPQPEADAKWGFIGRLWRSLTRPSRFYAVGTVGAFGILLGVLGWGGFNWTMELTNTETFCISCHEMRENVYREYQKTIHYNNRSGVRAICTDCHVPKEWIHKVIRKIRATNELYHHFMGSISTREKFEAKRLQLAQSVWQDMKSTDSRECRNCHSIEFMDLTKQENRSSRRHQDALKEGKTCIDCHKGVAHELPKGAFPGQRSSHEYEGSPVDGAIRQSLLDFFKSR
jgi:cytochrome c-type protein NapC